MTTTTHKRVMRKRSLSRTGVKVGTCACCGTAYQWGGLAPVATDFTYDRAVRQCSFERDDLVCQACRNDFEAEYGRDEYDAGDFCHD
jgi:hypothetical protein